MIKYSVTFSSNRYGLEKSEQEIKNLIIRLLECAGIDGATLTKNLTGIWEGQMEDSYTLSILSDSDITNNVEGLAQDIKSSLKQYAVLLEQAITDTKLI